MITLSFTLMRSSSLLLSGGRWRLHHSNDIVLMIEARNEDIFVETGGSLGD